MTNKLRILKNHVLAFIVVLSATLLPVSSASAFTSADQLTAVNSFITAFYQYNSGNAYFATSTSDTTHDGFWRNAQEIELMIDAYQATSNATYYNMVAPLCTGFLSIHGSTWTSDPYNDDISWGCLALMRAYSLTGTTSYATTAKNNFDAMWTRAYDTTLGGGLWWTTSQKSKTAAVNCPAALVAYLIYQYTGDTSYLTKSQQIVTWLKTYLYNSTLGIVYSEIDPDGTILTTPSAAHQATFLAACYYQGDTTNSTLAANYVETHWGTNMENGPHGGPLGGDNGICLRWMRIIGFDSTYRQTVANNAWSQRRTTDNLCWNDWSTLTPTGSYTCSVCGSTLTELFGWDCSSVVAALMNSTPSPPPALVQAGSFGAVSGSSITLNLPAASTTGNLLVATLANQSGYTFSAPSGWTLARGVNVSGSPDVEVWYYPNNPGGISSVTFTCSASSFPKGEITEWSGLSTSAPLDVTGASTITGSTTSAAVTTSSATAGTNDLAITFFVDHVGSGTMTFTPGSGWTNLANNGSVSTSVHSTFDYMIGVSGTVTETETSSVSGNWNNIIVTFKQ